MRDTPALLILALGLCLTACDPAYDDDDTGRPDLSDDDDDDDATPTDADPCDGIDNDGNGVVDDGHACAAGEVIDCTAHGACTGTAVCSDQCIPGECTNPAWECTEPGATEVCGSGACGDTRECLGDCTFDECATHCGADEACCPDGCADLTADVGNCGECGRACTYGDSPRCYGGGCCVDSARNGSEICDDQVFGVPSPYRRIFLGCQNDNGGVGYVSINTGPAQDDGVTRCQGWEDNGQDAWDHLQYVAQLTCDTEGQWLEVDLSMYEGDTMWFGSHDLPTGGGHMTDVCLAEGP